MTWLDRVGILIFLSFPLAGFSQVDWQGVPWQIIGSDSSSVSSGKKIMITGNIVTKGSSEPITGASISIDSYKYFDYSDAHGRYVLEIPPGNYRVMVRHVGMKQAYFRLHIWSGGVFNIQLEEGTLNLDEVVIFSRPIDSNVKQSISGLTTMGIGEIKTLPALMGEVDIIKGLQLMPGVTTIGEAATGFNVRGGRPDQNLVLLNGAPIFNTSHALGFVSAFSEHIVRDFSLYKGTVPAQLGGRSSSVLEINTRKGDFEKWNFQGGIGPLTMRIHAEGPVQNNKTSLQLSGRVAYPNWLLGKVDDANVRKSSASFNDLFISLQHRLNENNSLELNLYQSHDGFQFSDQFGYEWNNFLAQSAWRTFANRKASPLVALSYGRFQTFLIDPVGPQASQLVNGLHYLQFKPTVNYSPVESHTLTAGVESIIYLPEDERLKAYNASAIIPQKINKDNGWETALFLNDEFEVNERVSLSLGIRYSGYRHMGPDSVFHYEPGKPIAVGSITDTVIYTSFKKIKSYSGLEPRLAFRINTFANQSVKISYNRMRQYIHQISHTASATPVDLWQVSTQHLPPQAADNFSAGYFWNLKDNAWETSAEFFYKQMKNLVEYRDFPTLYVNRHLETELLRGEGRAYGGEFYIRRIKGRWTGWLSYTYSQSGVRVASDVDSESINNGNWFPSNYNKPHMVNVVLNRRMYDQGAFSIIASFASGRPVTAVQSSYLVNDAVVPIYSERNQYNIPNYFRLDVSLTIGNVVPRVEDSLVLSIYNLFGRDNAYSLFYQRPSMNFFIPKPYKLAILGVALPSVTYSIKF